MWFQRIFKNTARQILGQVKPGAGAARQPAARLSARSLRQLNRLQLNASRYLPGQTMGQRPSTRRRPSAEFLEHRSYAPGDDIRFVDWKASARQEHIFIKQGQQPKEATVYLLLDCSASMAWGEPPKSDALISLAAALGYLALAGGDRLFVITITEKGIKSYGPLNGKGQFPGLAQYLQGLAFAGRIPLRKALSSLRARLLGRGGLIFLLSDLLDMEQLSDALELYPAPVWDFVVLHLLHRSELEPGLRGDFELQDVETGSKKNVDVSSEALRTYDEKLRAWLAELEQVCVEQNAFYARIPTDWELDVDILPYLRDLDVLKPV